ncbi:MAG: hypothetical protein HC929_19845 [Leptolyngbyaceae cyanobacterium SM2_5_2]|nr:hypothetical protein [Leptolyngbyaceae cyanobacterium SM2_5_2]
MPPLDDIPEAARDTPLGVVPASSSTAGSWRLSKLLKRLLLFTLAAALALVAGSFAAWYQTAGRPGLELAKPLQGVIAEAGNPEVDATDPAVLDRILPVSGRCWLSASGVSSSSGNSAWADGPSAWARHCTKSTGVCPSVLTT